MIQHTPIMVQEVLDSLPKHCHRIMDGTFGHGGHSLALLQDPRFSSQELSIIGVDRDEKMIEKAKYFLGEDDALSHIQCLQGSYADLPDIIQKSGIGLFDYILLDIGVNMDHFKQADRGFSIKLDGPLDMRFDTSKGQTVAERLQKTHFEEMNSLFEKYTDFGQKYREGIVRDLLDRMRRKPLETTHDAKNRARGLGLNDKKLAVIFQAWRIHINKELDELEDFLDIFVSYLQPGGRCAIMTYHSGEDRIVKHSFKQLVDKGWGILYNKKVIKPNRQEVQKNKAARSAKLRIFEKNNT